MSILEKVLVEGLHCSVASKMSAPNFLFEINDIVMKKKILSVREHYDFEDVNGAKLGEAMAPSFSSHPNLS